MSGHTPVAGNAEGVAEGYDRQAGGYDARLGHNEMGAARLVAALPPGPYPRILDVGCGTGFASLAMAERHGTTHITGIDVSDAMLGRFRAKLAARPEVAIDLHRAGVHEMPVPGGAFDAVVCTMAIHWFGDKPDQARGIDAMAHALRPGGVLGVLGPAAGTEPEYLGLLESLDPPVPRRLVTSYAALAGAEDLEDWIAAAGLEPIDIWLEVRRRVSPPEVFLERMRTVASHLIADLPEHEQAALQDRLAAAVHGVSGPEGFRYTFNKVFAVARRPG
ncbi:MAG: methyltransferase domain-containing protein [Thermoleophilia bacterium]|nr:methyltransferase domain-containing protein [Thermoleophilia bacterium]